jgi:phage terminase large subunit GpA-like protein
MTFAPVTACQSTLDRVFGAIVARWMPPKKLSLSEWADEHAVLSAESAAEPGKWTNIPYQVGMMDALTDPDVERVSVIKSARVGYTKILNHAVGFYMHQDPCPIMVVQPTIEDAEGYSKDEIDPMLRDTPVLAGIVTEAKAKDGKNTILKKSFPGGNLLMIGANSPRGFRRVSIRFVAFDEVDGYPFEGAGKDGDQIRLGIRRTEYYWNRKILEGSTPTEDEISRIAKSFAKSEQHYYFVPCPHCDEFQVLKWGGKDKPYGIKWPDGDPAKAYYVCEHNGCVIQYVDQRRMVERGEWRCINPSGKTTRRHVGYHIWAAYSFSPNATWGQLAEEFVECKDDPTLLKTFVNTVLGEVWKVDYSKKLEAEGLAARARGYGEFTAPSGAVFVTIGVDVQDDRVAVVMRAWGEGEESWLVHHSELYGDAAEQLGVDLTSPEYPDSLAAAVDALVATSVVREDGFILPVECAAMDSGDGDTTHAVYSFVRQRQKERWIATKGGSISNRPVLGKPSLQDVNYKGKAHKNGVRLYMLGTDTAKGVIYARLKSDRAAGAGVYHFHDEAGQMYFDQLVAEKQVVTFHKGFARKAWVKDKTARNEALDCEVYAYAALQQVYTRMNKRNVWSLVAKRLVKKATPERVFTAKKLPADRVKSTIERKSNFVNDW